MKLTLVAGFTGPVESFLIANNPVQQVEHVLYSIVLGKDTSKAVFLLRRSKK